MRIFQLDRFFFHVNVTSMINIGSPPHRKQGLLATAGKPIFPVALLGSRLLLCFQSRYSTRFQAQIKPYSALNRFYYKKPRSNL